MTGGRQDVASHRTTGDDDAARLANGVRLCDGLGFQARVVSARANGLFHELTGQDDITPRQFGALLTLHQHGPMTLTELAQAISVDRSTLTEMVRRLQRDRLITRAGNGRDRRSAVVALSPEGAAAVLRLTPGAVRVQEVLLARLAPDERRQLLRWVKMIASAGEGEDVR